MNAGRFKVVGPREYRGHPTGTVFDARIDNNAARRAVARGDIAFLGEVTPAVPPGSFEFPEGWLTAARPTHRGAERRLTR